ncbi:hypothetical protein Ahy_B02g061208 [Arachis hypogaea]|uniref:Aminotransferase-like plant mobile domain-containing protein n=1 Tax=Arachis hypogaea TaxID=3818 RepID=A0A445AKI5_ARAHY|nr:hypothetical protein Ahy_B02g061208 [Arachis hypogaea]
MGHLKGDVSEMGVSPEAPTNWAKAGTREMVHLLCGTHEMHTTMAAAMKWYGFLLKAAKKCNMRDGGMNVEENLNRLDKIHIAAHLIHKPARVLTPHGILVDVFTSEPADPSMDLRRQRLEPYLRRAGFYYVSLIIRFEYDNPLISAFVERWRPETHTFHLPWGECTTTLEDAAMQLGLPIDGEPVSGTLRSWSKFHYRDIWQWCEELLGDVLPGHVGTMKYNIRLKISFWAPDVTMPHTFPLATRWAEKKGHNDYAEQRLLRHRLRLDNLQVDEFNWMPYMDPRILSRVPAKFLRHPHGDFYHLVVPLILFCRRTEAYGLHIDRADTLRPSQDFYRWYCDRTRRFLSVPKALHDPRTDDIPPGVPAEYGRAPAVRLPDVLQDRRR